MFAQPEVSPVSERSQTATMVYKRDVTHGLQYYEEVDQSQVASDAVGRPMAHLGGLKQATGEAIYCDDIPPYTSKHCQMLL